jgi:hypothetical protein
MNRQFVYIFIFLEELADKQKRDKLWNIYLGKLDTNKDKLKRAERVRIRNIEKQLAIINRTRMIMNETVVTPVTKCFIRRSVSESRSTFISHLSAVENDSNDRRRSSLDQQAIEQWKSIVDQNKPLEQFPWVIKKIDIFRHFRRAYKNSSKEQTIPMIDSPPTHEHLHDEQCHLLSPEKVINNQLRRPLTRKSNALLNPYITYFHLPINDSLTTNIQRLPLVTIKSDHHIIQVNDDECQF